MRKFFLILLSVAVYVNMHAQQSADSVTGEYYLQGVMETASVIRLMPDSTFQFFYSYGAVDRYGSGKWTLSNRILILNSRQRPALDFKLVESKIDNDNFITVQISDNNQMLLSYVHCIIKTKSGQHEAITDREGFARFPKEAVDSVALLFRLCPDRFSVFLITDKNQNFFQFKFEPWIAEVFFNHLQLYYENGSLKGKHPLLDGENFRYIKEGK